VTETAVPPVSVTRAALRKRVPVAEFTPPPSATKDELSATRNRQKREAVTVAEDLEVFVSDADLLSLIHAGRVRVHKHGSGKYRGGYLALRPAGGRKEKRPFLASGRPEKLKQYLAALGVHLCLVHRALSLSRCPQCGGN
jgi:hypothetical protein